MKIIKKNQIIIYTLALMLITAGYLNYTNGMSKSQDNKLAETSKKELVENSEGKLVEIDSEDNSIIKTNTNDTNTNNQVDNSISENNKYADIGDATLVSSYDVVEDYFAKSKLERENMYSQMLESYEKILNNSNSTDEQKKSITDEIKKLNNTKNSIMICENLIKTKGFENSVVFVNGDNVSIIVGANELKTEQIAQIQNIITRELNVGIENIHISMKKEVK
ncbi:MAG: SpoIIIAH-like family protein [Clostridia bacterium]|nr:SpoIIIAH-like family protein [Clostridia bacterium]